MPEQKVSHYPEHDKLSDRMHQQNTISEFLDWLDGQDFAICENTGERAGEWWPIQKRKDSIIAKFLDINEEKFNAEKDEMYLELQTNIAKEKENGTTR